MKAKHLQCLLVIGRARCNVNVQCEYLITLKILEGSSTFTLCVCIFVHFTEWYYNQLFFNLQTANIIVREGSRIVITTLDICSDWISLTLLFI